MDIFAPRRHQKGFYTLFDRTDYQFLLVNRLPYNIITNGTTNIESHTIFFWFNTSDTTNSLGAFSWGDGSLGTEQMVHGPDSTYGWANIYDSAANEKWTTNTYTTNVWNSYFYRFNYNVWHQIILNGDTANMMSEATSLDPELSAGNETMSIGINCRNGLSSDPYDGFLAYMTVWNKYLSLEDARLLNSGVHPLSVQRKSIGLHVPLFGRNPFRDVVGGIEMVPYGDTTLPILAPAVNDPVLYMEYKPSIFMVAGGSFSGGTLTIDNLSQSTTVQKPTLEVPPFFTDGFESGGTSNWTGSSGSPTINGASAILGSYGMELTAGGGVQYVYEAWTNSTKQEYWVRFYLNTNDLVGSGSDQARIMMLYDDFQWAGAVELLFSVDALYVRQVIRDDASVPQAATASSIPEGENIEIVVQFVFADTSGYSKIWINGSEGYQLTSVDCGTRYPDEVRFGRVAVAVAFDSGSYYVDHLSVSEGEIPHTLLTVDNLSQSSTVEKPTIEIISWRDGFETGDITKWDGSNGTPVINGTAAIDGSYGMEVDTTDVSNPYVTKNFWTSSLQAWRVKFKFNRNNISETADGQQITLVLMRDGTNMAGQVSINHSSGSWTIRLASRDDAAVWDYDYSSAIGTGDLEIEAQWDYKDTNGVATLWINGSQEAEITGIDSGTIYLDNLRFGKTLGAEYDSGTLYLDSFEVWSTLKSEDVLSIRSLSQSSAVDKVGITKQSALAVGNLSNANTVEHIALTQQLYLSVDGLSQSNAVDKFSLTQLHILQVDNLSQASTVQSIILQAEGYVAVYPLYQSSTVDHITTTKLSDIDVFDLSQSTTVTKISFSGGLVNLTLESLSQSSTLDVIGIMDQYATVYPRTLTNSNTIGHISLTQLHVIQNASDLSQSSSVDKVAVWANNNIDIKSLGNTNKLTKVSMTQIHVLVLPGAYVNSTVDNVGLWDWWYEIVEGVGLVTQSPDVVVYITRSYEGYGYIRQTEEQDGLIEQTLEEDGSIVQTYDVEGEIVMEYEGVGEI